MKWSRARLAALALAGFVLAGLLVEAQVTCVGAGCGRPFGEPIQLQNGTEAAPSFGFAGGLLRGMWFNTANNRWAFNGSSGNSTFVLDDTSAYLGSGIGIGWASTTNPETNVLDLSMARGGTNGALRILSGTTPTQSGTTCGTGPTISGNNTLGSVTLGTTPGLPCTIVFSGTWTNAPKCFLNPEVLTTATTTVRATGITTTQFVITSTAALVATDKVSWLCVSS